MPGLDGSGPTEPFQEISRGPGWNCRIVVMTSNSRNWPAQTFFGSAAERAVHNAPRSILLLRGQRKLSFKCNEPVVAVAAGV